MLRVGVFNQNDYAVKRNIYKKVKGGRVSYLELESAERNLIHRLALLFHWKLDWQMRPGITRSFMLDRCIFYVKPKANSRNTKKADFIHVWNQVCNTDKPWIVTLETKLPHCVDEEEHLLSAQYAKYVSRRDIRLVKKPNCRKIICFCENTYRQLELSVKAIDRESWQILKKKTAVMLPPQRRLAGKQQICQKYESNQEWNLLFVGRDLWCKGGGEMILALKKLRESQKFTLTVISTLEIYHQMDCNPRYSKQEIREIRRIIKKEPWIKWYKKLDNKEVLKYMEQSHLGLFPSYCDTFGYVALEMQACGCPVLSTDINALQEINNQEIGWVCRLSGLEPYYKSNPNKVRRSLQKQLAAMLKEVFCHRELTKQKAVKAAEYIEKNYSEKKFSERMYSLYLEAMENPGS